MSRFPAPVPDAAPWLRHDLVRRSLRRWRIEIREHLDGPLMGYDVRETPQAALESARVFLGAGLVVSVLDEDTRQPLAGPHAGLPESLTLSDFTAVISDRSR
jgi:hypothetical protein